MKNTNPLVRISWTVCLGFILISAFASYSELSKEKTPNQHSAQTYIDNSFGEFLTPDTGTLFLSSPENLVPVDPKPIKPLPELIDSLYENRSLQYQSASESMRHILEVLLVILVISLFILFFQPKEVEVPIVSFTLPDKLFYIVIPVAIVYLYFQLGLSMNASIDSRMVLEIMTDEIERADTMRVAYYYSNARTLVDGGLIDSWCAWHYDVFNGGRMGPLHQVNAFGILFLWFGTFLGLLFSVCLLLISVFHEKYQNRILSNLLFLVAIGGFFMWSMSMMAWYQHAAFLIAWMWGAALLSLIAWQRFGKKYAAYLTKKREASKQNQASDAAKTVNG
jgi:hypothetical protein